MPPSAPYRIFGFFRLLLAAFVFVQHALRPMAPAWVEEVLAPLELGSIAVLLFFALSGLIIAEAAMTFYRDRPNAFLVNRVLRIYPSYLIALAFTVALAALVSWLGSEKAIADHVGGSLSFSASELAANAFGILPNGKSVLSAAGALPIIDIAWALRVELTFYVVFFLALLFVAQSGLRTGPVLTAIACVLLGLWMLGLLGSGMFAYTPYFVLGIALKFAVSGSTPMGRRVAQALAAITFACCAWSLHLHPGQLAVFIALMVLWLALIAIPASNVPARLLRWDKAAGETTYPLYLLHTGTSMLVSAALPDRGWIAFGLQFAISLAAAVLATLTYEAWIGRIRERVRGVPI